jgi:hypothetical protein
MYLFAVGLAALLLGPAPLSAIRSAVSVPPAAAEHPPPEFPGERRRFYIFVAVQPVSLVKEPEASYLGVVGVDRDGRALDGRHRYVLHFARTELPPNDVLWSLTALENDPFRNPPKADGMVGRGAKLYFNPDGSFDLHLQRTRPEAPGINWVRTPAGAFNVVAHVRWPGAPSPRSDWKLPSVQRLN